MSLAQVSRVLATLHLSCTVTYSLNNYDPVMIITIAIAYVYKHLHSFYTQIAQNAQICNYILLNANPSTLNYRTLGHT